MIVRHNIAAMNTYRQNKNANRSASDNMEKLSSGYKINRASDDAAGLAISEKMRAQIRGLGMAQRNTEDALNLLKTMDGGMAVIQDMMLRQRELMVYAANDTNEGADREKIQLEIDQLTEEIGTVAERCKFNNIPLLTIPSSQSGETGGAPLMETTTETVTETEKRPVYRTERIPSEATQNRIETLLTVPPVELDGMFDFWATNSAGSVKSKLHYEYSSSPETSSPAIRVNGLIYSLWSRDRPNQLSLDAATVYDAVQKTWSTKFGLHRDGVDLTVTQRVSVVDNPPAMGGQSYKIEYEVVNNAPGSDVTFDMMHNLDIQLGSNDRAPLEVGGEIVKNGVTYTAGSMPGQINAYDDVDSRYIKGVIITNSGGGLPFTENSEPDKVYLGYYDNIKDFDVGTSGKLENPTVQHDYEDTGYSAIWSNRTTSGSNPYTMTTYYGVMDPPPEGFDEDEWIEVEVLDHYEEVTVTREVDVTRVVPIDAQTRTVEDKRLWIQSGPNGNQGMFVDRYDCRPESLYRGVFRTDFQVDVGGKYEPVRLSKLDVSSVREATASLMALDSVFGSVNTYRARAGAQYNRLEFTLSALGVSEENLSGAESRIRDADMAKEMMELAKSDTLRQAGAAMLAQANQASETVLQLLG